MGKLPVRKMRALTVPGRYGDGGTLHLVVSPRGTKSWVQRITIDGKRHDLGLGGWPIVSLAMARDRVFANRRTGADGRDPLAAKRRPKVPTFRQAAELAFEANRARWRSAKTSGKLERRDGEARLSGLRRQQPGRPPQCCMRQSSPRRSGDSLAARVIDLALRVGGRPRGSSIGGLQEDGCPLRKRQQGLPKASDVETPKTITIHFRKDEAYRVLPVNAVWGGVTPRGDIMVDLCHESQPQPDAITHEVTPEGIGAEIERTPPTPLIQRTVLVGMVLTPEHAESIGFWLQGKARESRELRTGVSAGEQGGGNGEPSTSGTY